ncbi:MAG: hypothetical protein SYR96_17265 [Actinomycetota bacterium]|nr:hypothetical protein [Actinomycetota bacterium]
MRLIHIPVTAAVTLSIAAASYSQFDARAAERQARSVAEKATCRAVDSAILAYVGVHGDAPETVRELAGYVKGDISSYRIVRGEAAGPGCA